MKNTLTLFPDTNVLEQCRALPELDWQFISGDAEEVHLIVARPVQTEIDNHKNRGNERIARRARKAAALFRDLIIGNKDQLVIRDANPRVTLSLLPTLRPSHSLARELSYESSSDDQLVGIVRAHNEERPEAVARLLTHDTGPMATARAMGVPFTPVPDDWLLPPEPTEEGKRIRSLEVELLKLRRSEPDVDIRCLNPKTSQEVEKLEIEFVHYEELSPLDISKIADRLKTRVPQASDFGSTERKTRTAPGLLAQVAGLQQVFDPPSEKEIAEYHASYHRWIEDCRTKLAGLQAAMQSAAPALLFEFAAMNKGSRPANSVLITFHAEGSLKIFVGADDDERANDLDAQIRKLPSSPSIPTGRWKMEGGAFDAERLEAFSRRYDSLRAGSALRQQLKPLPVLPINPSFRRDPNNFYYKPSRPYNPVEEFNLECDQWRHEAQAEIFSGKIWIAPQSIESGFARGAVTCRVQAENLSSSVSKVLPVEVRVRRASLRDIAIAMVDAAR